MKSFNQGYNYDSTKQDLYQNPHNHHQMYISNTTNHFNNVHQVEPSLIDPNNCQSIANVFIIQPQYTHYDYAIPSTNNDYSQNIHTTNTTNNLTPNSTNNNEFNATLPIMDVDSFVANLSNLEEVHYCIDQSSNQIQHQNQQPHLLLPTQHLSSIESHNQTSNQNHQISHQNKQNFESYSLSNLNSNANMNHQNYLIGNTNVSDMVNNNNNNNNNINSDNGKLNEKMTKVDILNQVILNATNTTNLTPKTSMLDFNRNSNNHNYNPDPSNNQYHNFNGHINNNSDNINSNNNNNTAKIKKSLDLKLKYKQKDNKICCNVCGHKSSGYHYGSHTCEACKLFFRRTEKQIRKTGFNECKTKNCKINYETRANCSACRYKKCIAVGMGMSRSRFGRHTEKLSENYAPNTDSLCSLLNNLKLNCYKQNCSLEFLNNVILEFYYNSLNLLAIKNNQNEEEDSTLETNNNSIFNIQNDNSSSFNSSSSFTNNSTLSELSSILKTSKLTPETSSSASSSCAPSSESLLSQSKTVILPDCVIILFCVLFEINIDKYLLFNTTYNFKINKIISDYEQFLHFTEERLFQKKKLAPLLRIGLFIKIMRLLLESKIIKEDLHDKRITDLMRSEFAPFRYDQNAGATSASNSSSSSFSTDFDKSNDATSSSKDSFGQSNLVLIFTNINHLLYKHMSSKELDHFVFKRCFESEF